MDHVDEGLALLDGLRRCTVVSFLGQMSFLLGDTARRAAIRGPFSGEVRVAQCPTGSRPAPRELNQLNGGPGVHVERSSVSKDCR